MLRASEEKMKDIKCLGVLFFSQQFPRAVIPRLSQCCIPVPDTHTYKGGSTSSQEERFGGELSSNNRICVPSER